MANPRKFSEKIALHTHRQAEETARFEQIMKEVSDATAKDEAPVSTVNYRPGTRGRSQGGPIRRHDRRLDTSPYSSNSYLALPHDTSWRRTHSDSALHQSAMQEANSDRNDNCGRWMLPTNGPENNDRRPRSSCEAPRVPGINIYPSVHVPGTIQIPISSNNTGSLPDLTNVNFSSPIRDPLDQDGEKLSSSYRSSPVHTNPSTLSPTSIPQGVRQDNFYFSHPSHVHTNHLSVPMYANYPNKQLQQDKNISGLVEGNDFSSQMSGSPGSYQQCPTSPTRTLSQASCYRSPRPSPQSSPSLGGRHSAPCSPGAPSPISNDYSTFNQQQFQQHFEQLSMMDSPLSGVSYGDQPSGQMSQSHNQSASELSTVTNLELGSDPGYYSTSPSQLVYPPSLHTTPNTPTSIPDIILTDFSSAAAEELSRQDINKLDTDFFSEESLRESLEPLNFDELQMLTDPTMNLISDSVEDGFRLHRS